MACNTTVDHFYVGTIGLEILIDTGMDLSTATAVSILIRRQNGTTGTWTAEPYADGTAEQTCARYKTVAGDLDVAGVYQAHARVTLADGSILTGALTEFLVENLYGQRS